MKLRDDIGLIDQGMASEVAAPTDKWVVPALAGFFRARHLWSDTVYVTLNLYTKITAGGCVFHIDGAIRIGSETTSLPWRSGVMSLIPATR